MREKNFKCNTSKYSASQNSSLSKDIKLFKNRTKRKYDSFCNIALKGIFPNIILKPFLRCRYCDLELKYSLEQTQIISLLPLLICLEVISLERDGNRKQNLILTCLLRLINS